METYLLRRVVLVHLVGAISHEISSHGVLAASLHPPHVLLVHHRVHAHVLVVPLHHLI